VNDETKQPSCFAELCDDLILLKIVNFHKYIGRLVNKIAKCGQTETSKTQGGIKRGVSADSNLSHQAEICLLNHLFLSVWVYHSGQKA